MTQYITRSVGRSGANLRSDVQVVQELLNQVVAADGGPPVPLKADGLCGPKTLAAIKAFQERQFGAAAADGRVDPYGRTLARLNDLDRREPVLTTTSVLLCPHGGTVTCIPTGPPPNGPVPNGLPLRTTDPGVVAGCAFPSPCVRVQWLPSTNPALTATSIGLCMSAAGIPQGPVSIVKV